MGRIFTAIAAILLFASSVLAQPALHRPYTSPLCSVGGTVYINASPAPAGTRVTIRLPDTYAVPSNFAVYAPGEIVRLTDSAGTVSNIALPSGAYVSLQVGNASPRFFTVPYQTFADLSQVF